MSTSHIGPFIRYVAGASIFQVSRNQTQEQKGGGKRGGIKGFSYQSRLRLMRLIGSIMLFARLPMFVTLTYPDRFPSVEEAKRDLKVFCQRIKRAFPLAGLIWKLEPQERGAPHYHMLVWGAELVDLLPWVVNNWYDIAGDGDRNHYLFHAGQLHDSKPCVSKVESWRGVWSYASKYLGKTFEVAEWGSTWTGRFWGIINPHNIPFGEEKIIPVTMRQANHVMRYQRRFMKKGMKKGFRVRAWNNSLTIFCTANQWVDCIGRET